MDINFNINFDRLVKFSTSFWIKVGSFVVRRIREDAGRGVFQTDEPVKKTYSKDYAELKERRFRAKTKNRYKNLYGGESGKKILERVKIANGRKGERLEQYKGVSIVSTNTSFVDMTATGQTLRGLHVVEGSVTEKGVSVAFHPRDIDKIVGNQKPGLNRRLVGLNKRNVTKIQEMIITDIQDKVAKEIVGRTTINIKI